MSADRMADEWADMKETQAVSLARGVARQLGRGGGGVSIFVKTRIHYGKSDKVRTWFGCDRCTMYGDYTIGGIEAATAMLDLLDAKHNCAEQPAEATP